MATETAQINRRILLTQSKVIEDEKAILSGRIRNYLKSHRTDVLEDIFMSIYQLGREHQRLEFYENSIMNAMDKASQHTRSSSTKKSLKKAYK